MGTSTVSLLYFDKLFEKIDLIDTCLPSWPLSQGQKTDQIMNHNSNHQEIVKGRYRLEQVLGSGGMGVVYSAWDRLKQSNVAFKKVLLDVGEDYSAIANTIVADQSAESVQLALAQEFQTLATMRHPNIISVLDYGFDDFRQPWFTMSLIEDGKTLLEACANLNLEDKIDLIAQMVRAVAYLHRRGIFHRDLKPENVLVTNGVVKILDFGLASEREQLEATAEISGTVGYLAPEVLRGELTTHASDYFAVGIMIYEALTGRPFYPEYDFSKIYQHILGYEAVIHEDDMPVELAELVHAMTHKDPQQRLADPAEIIRYLALFASSRKLSIETTATRESFLQAAGFVGRDDEISQLNYAMGMASTERGSAWLIGGESGVGKSRLVNEVRVRAMVEGAIVLQGQATEDSQGLPYELWREIVSQLVLLHDPDDLTAGVLKSIVPDIENLLGRPIPNPPQLDGSAARQRIHSTVTNLFDLKDEWVLLILEDLQWDENSLDILMQLNRVVHNYNLMILATFRSDEAPDLPEIMGNMNLIQLQRFSKDEMSDLSLQMLGPIAESKKLQEVLESETEGNAFFLIELVRELAEITGGLSEISAASLPEKLLPKGIATIIERRLGRVPPDAQSLLKYAAINGRQPNTKVLEHISQVISLPYSLPEWLSLCSDAAVLETFNGEWRFTHDKIREGIVFGLDERETVSYHQQVAQAILKTYPDDDSHAAALSHHWRKAGNVEMERLFVGRAGEFARSRFLNRDAIEYYSRAIELTPEDQPVDVFDLLLSMEDIQNLLADRNEQEISIRRLNELADFINSLGGPDVGNEARLRLGRYQIAKGHFTQAIETSEEILTSNPDNGSAVQIEALRQLGEANMHLGKYDESLQFLEKLIGITKKNSRPMMMGAGYQQMGETLIYSKRYEDATPYLQEAQKIFKSLKLKQKEAVIFNDMGIVSQAQGKIGESIDHWATCQAIYQEIGDRLGNAKILTNLCALNLDLGDYLLAKQYGEKGLEVCQELSNEFGECLNLLNLAIISSYLDHHQLSEIYCHAAIYIATNMNNPHLIANANRELGLILTHQDRLEEAEETYQYALELSADIEQEVLKLEVEAELAQLYLRRGDHERADAIIEPLVKFLSDGNQIDAAIHPFRLYTIGYLMMRLHDDQAAHDVLNKAHIELVKRADRILDAQKRTYFLRNIREHRQILSAYKKMSILLA